MMKALRIYLGLSQVDFAKKVGVSPDTISNIERGITPITLRTRMCIAKVYDVDVGFLETLEKANRIRD